MDPISIASATGHLAELLAGLRRYIQEFSDRMDTQELLRLIEEFQVLNEMLMESAFILTRLHEKAPKSAASALKTSGRISNELAAHIYGYTSELKRSGTRRQVPPHPPKDLGIMKEILERFRTSSSLLRSIATDALTHELLQRQVAEVSDSIARLLGSTKDRFDSLEDGILRLRSEMMSTYQSRIHPQSQEAQESRESPSLPATTSSTGADASAGARASDGTEDRSYGTTGPAKRSLAANFREDQDPETEAKEFKDFLLTGSFTQYGTVCTRRETGPHVNWHPVRVKLDPGSKFDLVSQHLLDRIVYTHTWEDSVSVRARGLGGSRVELRRKAKLEWTLDKLMKVIATTFYVVVNEPFDILVGDATIKAQEMIQDEDVRDVMLFLDVPGRGRDEKNRTKEKKKSKGKAVLSSLFGKSQGSTSNLHSINMGASSSAASIPSTTSSNPAQSTTTTSTTTAATPSQILNPVPSTSGDPGPSTSHVKASSGS